MPVTLDQIAMDWAQMAKEHALATGEDPIAYIDGYYKVIPPGFHPTDAWERAKEMLRDWEKYQYLRRDKS